MKRLALLVILAACVDQPATVVEPQASVVSTRPNILLIMTDDQALTDMWAMPKTRAMIGGKGTTFSQAFTPTSLCCPSRVSILRGQYAHNHGVWANGAPLGGWPKANELGVENNTIATWLQGAGYSTGWFGKYLNEHPLGHVPPGWNEWQEPAAKEHYAVTSISQNGVITSIPPAYNTDLLATLAQKWIKGQTLAGASWFAFVSFKAPHRPMEPAARHAGMFAAAPLPMPPNFELTAPADIAEAESLYRGRLELLQAVDDGVELLLNYLNNSGQINNTLIIFTSDNGFMIGEHGEWNKNKPWEESIRVPLLIRGPGVVKNVTRAHMAMNIDFAPTIADYAGIPVPAFVDGRSLRPVLEGSITPSAWRTGILHEHGDGQKVVGVRTATFKFVQNNLYAKQWAYDLEADPYELTSVLTKKSKFIPHQNWLRRFRYCAGETCRVEDRANVR